MSAIQPSRPVKTRFITHAMAVREILNHLLRPDQGDAVAAVCALLTGGQARAETIQIPRLNLATCGIWYQCDEASDEEFFAPREVEGLLTPILENADIVTVACVYTRVMQIEGYIGRHPENDRVGIWVIDETDQFCCKQCGRCCSEVTDAYNNMVLDEDIARWHQKGRTDILALVSRKPYGNIAWIDPQTGDLLKACPWLCQDPDTDKSICAIHTTKPRHCANFPYTKRHAYNSGCPGFNP